MLGIIVQLVISWLIIWIFEKGNLNVLGLCPSRSRMTAFALFFLVTGFCSASQYFMRMFFASEQWVLNPALSSGLILEGIWWNVKSVLFEELIFRGVLLYILIKKLGPAKGVLISSIAFGIYHWFSHGVIGNPAQMVITFITTGLMGMVYAYAYARTFSLYMPIAIHLGWNLVRSVIFSDAIIGNQLLVEVKPVPQVTVGFFLYFCIIYLPMLGAMVINFFMLKNIKQASPAL
ncbi:MAG TPA: CPBP family intramembrane glutamic endopeptidase [Ferruginibacter sp.]|nr:CPBP family intramembrane glutamic endopeptidase [Ferruginibacter sp.]